MLAFMHELAEELLDLTPDMQRVSAFLDLAATDPKCRLLVIESKFLREKAAFGLVRAERFMVCKFSKINRTELLKACVSHGHLSVFFMPSKPNELLHRFEQLGFYGPGIPTHFATGDLNDVLGKEELAAFRAFLDSDAGSEAQAMFGFSHDAAEFYEIYPFQ